MKRVQKDCILELKYTLREGGREGNILEVMDEHWPLKFYFGAGTMLPDFERNIKGLAEGQGFEFTIKAADAYGELKSENIREIPFGQLPDSERFPNKNYEVGDRLVFNMGAEDQMLGTVSEVLENSVLVDFNHALAGKDMHFEGRILFIREPRSDEAVAKRYIEPNGIRSSSRLEDGRDA